MHIFKLMGIPTSIGTFPGAYSTSEFKGLKEESNKFKKKINELFRHHGITEEIVCKLYLLYRDDFEMFGYKVEPFLIKLKTADDCAVFYPSSKSRTLSKP